MVYFSWGYSLLAKASFCKNVGVPKAIKPRIWESLQRAAKIAGVNVFLVNYQGVSDSFVTQAKEALKDRKAMMKKLKG